MNRILQYTTILFALFLSTHSRGQVATEVGGVVAFEAENFTTNLSPETPVGSVPHSWTLNSVVTGYSGTGYMEATPNAGPPGGNADANSPQLQYLINFTSTGTHYVWVRASADSNTDDSIYSGIDGTAGSTASTLNQYGVWQWTNLPQSGTGAPTISVASTGNHTVNFWMREDGFRFDRVIITTNATFAATTGNAWHIPVSAEATGGATMRTPLMPNAGTAVTIYNGSQFQGGGTPGNQLQTGSTVFYRRLGDTNWSSTTMAFSSTIGNNKYYAGTIPTTGFNPGDSIQYYLRIPFSDHLPTFLYGSDSVSHTSENESDAQGNPFIFTVAPALQPNSGGNYLPVDSGNFEARVYTDTGHIVLAQPDLQGNALASTTTIAPATVKIGDRFYAIGQVTGSMSIPNGLQLTQTLGNQTITSQLTFTSDGVNAADGVLRYEVTNWNAQNWNNTLPTETDFSAGSDTSEHFYGFGEKFNSFDQAGNKVHIMTNDQGGTKGDFTYKSSSWFVSNHGYGLHLDSTAESYFDMRNGQPDRYSIQNLFGTLKFNIVGGPQLTSVMTRYTGYTGRPYLPPPWVFGTWVSSDIWRTGGEVRYAITKYRASGIPISVFVFDSPWEVSYNDFVWNNSQFAAGGTYENVAYNGFSDYTQMLTFLEQNGVKVVCWFTPFLNTSSFQDNVGGATPGQNTGQSPNYATAATNGYFVKTSTTNPAPLTVSWWKGTGSPIDFTNPSAKAWFQGQLTTLLNQSKVLTTDPVIGGFKTDDGEALNSGAPYIPTTASYFNGKTGLEMQNGYCVTYHEAVSELVNPTGILFSRSGFNGTGAFPGGWPGDNQPNYTQDNGLQSVITAGCSAAMSGFSIWGHDIGGYQNANFTTDPADLFMRWTQFGAFTPIMQMHRQVDPSNLQQYPWGYTPAALANFVTYTNLHSQLFPYLYTYAWLASTTGVPIIRPPILLNQTDATEVAVQHTYYFGNELLVAPMNAQDSTSRQIQMPAGNWYDFWTNAKYPGSQTLTWTNSDTTKFPLFVREGSIIPMLINIPQTMCDPSYVSNPGLTTRDSGLQFLIYPGPSTATFTLYDGTTAACTEAGTVTKINLNTIGRQIALNIFQTATPAGVERNGQRLPNLQTLSAFNAATLGWFYDSTNQFVRVKFTRTQATAGSEEIDFGPDTVGDGVTDSWRAFYGITDDNADSDGDGLTNLQEYFAGTNPNDPGSTFSVQSVTPVSGGPGFVVSWQSQPAISYEVQWKHALSDATWNTVSLSFTGTGQVMMFTDDGSQTASFPDEERFYRVIIP